jgi:1-phosphofructokinase
MIYTVTCNPALDKTVTIQNFAVNKVNRVLSIRKDAGGKGINVSKMLNKLGEPTCAMGFLGLETGRYIEKELKLQGIQASFVHTQAETRTNLKVVDPFKKTHTDINEPGEPLSQADIKSLEDKLLSMVQADDIVVFSGKTANGMDESIIRDWIIKCKHKKARVFVDAEKSALKLALEARPNMIKPNQEELESITGKELISRQEMILECERILENGVSIVVLSLGGEGAMFFNQANRLYAKALDVPVKSTVGAGDSMMAAFAYGVHNNLTFEEAARLSMAVSAAKVTCEGTKMPERKQIDDLLEKVHIEMI